MSKIQGGKTFVMDDTKLFWNALNNVKTYFKKKYDLEAEVEIKFHRYSVNSQEGQVLNREVAKRIAEDLDMEVTTISLGSVGACSVIHFPGRCWEDALLHVFHKEEPNE
jgi:hypothetical protein